jgi:hypothetical protein
MKHLKLKLLISLKLSSFNVYLRHLLHVISYPLVWVPRDGPPQRGLAGRNKLLPRLVKLFPLPSQTPERALQDQLVVWTHAREG